MVRSCASPNLHAWTALVLLSSPWQSCPGLPRATAALGLLPVYVSGLMGASVAENISIDTENDRVSYTFKVNTLIGSDPSKAKGVSSRDVET